MRSLLRHLRRPVVILPLLYIAGVGLLAAVMQYRPRFSFGQKEACFLVGFSPDGNRLATCPPKFYTMNQAGLGVGEGPIRVWNLNPREASSTIPNIEIPNNGLMETLAKSPGCRRVFWQVLDGHLDLRSLITKIVSTSRPASRPELPSGGSFSPGGIAFAYLVAEGGVPRANFNRLYTGPETLDLVETSTGRRILSAPDQVLGWAFSPDGATLTTLILLPAEVPQGPRQCRTIRWDCRSGKQLDTVSLGTISGPAHLSQDGRWVISHDVPRNQLVVYDSATGRRCLGMSDASDETAVTARVFIAGLSARNGSRRRLEFWDLTNGEKRGQFALAAGEGVSPTPNSLSPDGRSIAVGFVDVDTDLDKSWPRLADWLDRNGFARFGIRPSTSIIDLPSGRELARLPGESSSDPDQTGTVFSDDGQLLAVLSVWDGVIRIWDNPPWKPWPRVLSIAAVPPAALALLFLAVRGVRRLRTPRTDLSRAV